MSGESTEITIKLRRHSLVDRGSSLEYTPYSFTIVDFQLSQGDNGL